MPNTLIQAAGEAMPKIPGESHLPATMMRAALRFMEQEAVL